MAMSDAGAVWRPLSRAMLRRAPAALRPWLAGRGSLTAALRGACASAVDCTLLAQGWRAASAHESVRLRLAPGAPVFWRRVRFMRAGRPLLVGNTVVPPRTLARWPALRRLGDRPVGELVFAVPGTCRQQVELAVAPAAQAPALASRRSVIALQGGTLLVEEHFLPAALSLGAPPCR
ncbi:MAG: hypothetical protein Kow0073_06240 [Immundisolibacter sp.]